jgi:2-methylcitrate dehydratase PrpD
MTSPPRREFAGQTLGRFVAESSWADIGPDLRHEAKRALLNYVGGALGVSGSRVVDAASRVVAPFSGPQTTTVIGRPERLDLMAASFVNAIAANLLDYDDTHPNTVGHPTAPVAPPLFALAEQRGLSGAALLHAFILGFEVECRLGNAVQPDHYNRGWHITATCGVFGSAAACAKLLGLSAEQTWTALGLAASQSASIIENLTTEAKNVGVGNAARNGLLAALLAREGFSAAPAAIEGPFGWARVSGQEPMMEEIVGGLGERWELPKNTYKPYPSGIVFHAIIDAALELRSRLNLTAADIAAVTVRGDQLMLDRGERPIDSERDARVSIHHSAALGLAVGKAGVREHTAPVVFDPQIMALRGKVRAELADMPPWSASVTVETVDGRTETATVEHARGSPKAPMSDADLEAKFRDNAALGGSADKADARIAGIWAMEETADLAPLLRSMGA